MEQCGVECDVTWTKGHGRQRIHWRRSQRLTAPLLVAKRAAGRVAWVRSRASPEGAHPLRKLIGPPAWTASHTALPTTLPCPGDGLAQKGGKSRCTSMPGLNREKSCILKHRVPVAYVKRGLALRRLQCTKQPSKLSTRPPNCLRILQYVVVRRAAGEVDIVPEPTTAHRRCRGHVDLRGIRVKQRIHLHRQVYQPVGKAPVAEFAWRALMALLAARCRCGTMASSFSQIGWRGLATSLMQARQEIFGHTEHDPQPFKALRNLKRTGFLGEKVRAPLGIVGGEAAPRTLFYPHAAHQ